MTVASTWTIPPTAPSWVRRLVDWLRPSYASVAFAGLWLAAGLARFGLYTHGFRLRLSEALSLAILAGVILLARFRLSIPWPGAIFPVVYVGMEALSTLVNPSDWTRGFKLDLLLATEAVLAVGVATLATMISLRTLARIIVGVGALAAAVAIALTVLYRLHGTEFGVQVDPVTGLCKSYGTMYEANLLGSYLAAVLIFSLAVERYLSPPWFAGGSRGLMLVALGLTLTRAAWFAAFAGAVMLLALAMIDRVRLRRDQVLVIAAGAGLALFTAFFVLQAASSRPCGPVRASELSAAGSVSGRFANHILALSEWASSPIWGLGTGSTRASQPNDPNQPWISSLGIATLHDTGVIGAVLVGGLLVLLLWALLRWRRPVESADRWFRYGLAAGIVTLLVAFQATTGTLMEYPWLFFGTAIGILYGRQASAAVPENRAAPRTA